MIFKSLEEEEAWNAHLARLAAMSPEDKRDYGRRLDAVEKANATRFERVMERDAAKAKRLRVHTGIIGVSRADLKK